MSITTTDTSDQFITVNLDVCSTQVRELYPLHQGYQQQVQKLWADTSDNPGPRQLQRRGYRYLASLFYDMPKRAETDSKPMSSEFNDLIYFCRYVGPRPTGKHSLHRLNNDLGYCCGNVEWADKRKQAEVRRTTQHHRYLGRRLTDRQLADLLRAKGHKITAGAIKKQRQRRAKTGIAPTDITRSIFEKCGLPYETSDNPVETWDFPEEFHQNLSKLYPHLRGTNETRIQFFARWLQGQVQSLDKDLDNPYTSKDQRSQLAPLIFKYRCEVNQTNRALERLHQKKMDKVISEASAPFSQKPQIPSHQELNHPANVPSVQPPAALSTQSQEESRDIQKRALEQQKKREKIAYLLTIINSRQPNHNKYEPDSSYISDDQLQGCANYAYFTVMNQGSGPIRDLLLDYRKRGIPMPGADIPPDVEIPPEVDTSDDHALEVCSQALPQQSLAGR